MRRVIAPAAAIVITLVTAVPALATATPTIDSRATSTAPRKTPVAEGYGGAVSTVDLDASRAAIAVLKKGGNAVDAAVAAGAVLGVTEPYSAGLTGGGFIVFYDAEHHKVHTIDGRETAPRAMTPTTFEGIPFEEGVTSGLSAGVPGAVAQWDLALRRFGTISLKQALKPAIEVASQGFVVDQTFFDQTQANLARFKDITSTAALYLPNGAPPPVGSVFRNPDLAATYRELGRRGPDWLYGGQLGKEVVATVKQPPVASGVTRKVRPGLMELSDLRDYRALLREPTRVDFRGLRVYGMAPPSSGGSTVGEALNVVDALPDTGLHEYLEASRLAFADRNKYVGDIPGVPLKQLLSDGFAKERACLVGSLAMTSPVAPGAPDGDYQACASPEGTSTPTAAEGPETTHLVVADRWGNVVAYNLTIESTGGNGIVVPGRGVLLNNELTDFTFGPAPGDPNLPGPGKRPRSSMAPTIVFDDGEPIMAVGSPGGATIITTVLQILLNRYVWGMSLPEAVAAPRASQRNTAQTQAEPAFLQAHQSELEARRHSFASVAEIGAATALEFTGKGRVKAVAEPVRRGGGSALVVRPAD
ncbi:gamma-glutamyltransferase family protein [Nonomuraea sp. NPDC005501]|uniref:gamma-glutamyltransferase family protein n=1 Tax=Nonomuraea sp. NPDC005501 TaxID=3156884 RepID=UPI0033BC27A6